MAFDRAALEDLERFLGTEWLESGCRRIQQRVNAMLVDGFLDESLENTTHPIHQLWYKLVWDRPLPTDQFWGGSEKLDQILAKAHRLYTVNYLIGKHLALWSEPVVEDIRNKLRNIQQFAATLYELEVLDNFRRAGHLVNLLPPSKDASPDMTGKVSGVECDVECKHIGFRSSRYQSRQHLFEGLKDGLLRELRRIGQPGSVNVAFYDTPKSGAGDIEAIISVLRNLTELPDEEVFTELRGRAAIQVKRIPLGPVRFVGDPDNFTILHFSGARSTDGTLEPWFIVGIQDHVPFNWRGNVRRTLQSAVHQLGRSRANIVCLELADIAHFQDFQQFDQVARGVQLFLENDSTRVSAVLVSISGIQPGDEPASFRSAGGAWLFHNRRAVHPIPPSFEVPSFDYPKIRVEGTGETREVHTPSSE